MMSYPILMNNLSLLLKYLIGNEGCFYNRSFDYRKILLSFAKLLNNRLKLFLFSYQKTKAQIHKTNGKSIS